MSTRKGGHIICSAVLLVQTIICGQISDVRMSGEPNTLRHVVPQPIDTLFKPWHQDRGALTCKDFVAGRIEANRIRSNDLIQVVICSIRGPKLAGERVPHVQRVISAGANEDARRWLS